MRYAKKRCVCLILFLADLQLRECPGGKQLIQSLVLAGFQGPGKDEGLDYCEKPFFRSALWAWVPSPFLLYIYHHVLSLYKHNIYNMNNVYNII